MTRESKAGLLMIVMLAGVFGFMVYKRTHQPAAAMAQQNVAPETPEGEGGEGDSGESTEPKDPFLALDEAPGKVTPAAAAAPAALAVEADSSPVSRNDIGAKTSGSGLDEEADPFGTLQSAAPRSKPSLPTTIEDDSEPRTPASSSSFAGFRESSSEKSTSATTAAAARPVAANADAASQSDNSSFDPFNTDVQETPSQSVPVRSRRPDVTAEADPFDEPASRASAATNAGPQRTPAEVIPVPSQPKIGGTDDPFETANQGSTDGFEAPTPAKRTPVDFPDSQRQETVNSDPFDTRDNLDVQRPASSTPAQPAIIPPAEGARSAISPATDAGTVPESFSNDSAFETPNPSQPAAVLDSNIEEAFDQPTVRSNVPALNIPSRDAAPATSAPSTPSTDDKFGGFRPALPSDSTARAFPGNEHPAEPSISSDSMPSRVIRPAPATQIDEDFGSTTSSRPLVAGDTYLIEPGDNFWTISRKKYGTGRYFMALAQHNLQVIPDPRRMRPGVSIATPSAASLERAYSQLVPKAAAVDPVQMASTSTTSLPTRSTSVPRTDLSDAEAGFFIASDGTPMYRVGQEDTLSGISQHHLGRSSRWVQILELNRDVLIDGNTLKIGAVLRLPADASRVEVVDRARILR